MGSRFSGDWSREGWLTEREEQGQTVTKEVRHSWGTVAGSESPGATNEVPCEEDLACERYTTLCKTSTVLNESWDYSVIYRPTSL